MSKVGRIFQPSNAEWLTPPVRASIADIEQAQVAYQPEHPARELLTFTGAVCVVAIGAKPLHDKVLKG